MLQHIAIVPPPLLSPIASAAIYGNCHCAVAAVLPSIAPPPLMPIGIVPLLLPSPIVTPTVTHRLQHHPSQLRCHPSVYCAVATITHCNCTAIMPPCVTAWQAAAPQHADWLSHWTGCPCITSCCATTSQCVGWLSRCLLMHHPLVCPG